MKIVGATGLGGLWALERAWHAAEGATLTNADNAKACLALNFSRFWKRGIGILF